MGFDAIKNNPVGSVATAPSPASSGTSLILQAGQGAFFPATPFNATVWPVLNPAANANFEIVRVTAIATDTLTITRAQEGSTARSIQVGDRIAATITAGFFAQIIAAIAAFATNMGSFAGSKALGSGVSSGSVTGLGLPFTPTIALLTISTPSGGPFLAAAYDATTLTAAGFNFVLSGATPASGYSLEFLLL